MIDNEDLDDDLLDDDDNFSDDDDSDEDEGYASGRGSRGGSSFDSDDY